MSHVRKKPWTYKGETKTAWVVSYIDQDGVKRQKTFKTFKEANRFRSEVDVEIAKGEHVAERATCTVAVLAEGFLRDCERREKIGDRMGKTCLYNYRLILQNHIVKKFGARFATELTARDVQKWVDDLAIKYKRQTVARSLCVLKLMLAFAVREKLLMRNVVVDGGVRVPTMKRSKVQVPTRQQIRSILSTAANRVPGEVRDCATYSHLVVHLALLCGLRASEIAGLDWKAVRFDEECIIVEQSYSCLDGIKDPKSKAGFRKVHLSPPVTEALRGVATYKGKNSSGPIFISRARVRHTPHGVWVLWRNAAKRAGLIDAEGKNLFRLHDLRHAAIALMIGEGLSPMHIKTFAGHSKIATTLDVYGHLFPDDVSIKNASASIAAQI